MTKRKLKRISLKTIHKNILTISAIFTLSIGTLKEVITFLSSAFEKYNKKAYEVVDSLERVGENVLSPMMKRNIGDWFQDHWGFIMVFVGILLITLIYFIVDEIKENKEKKS